MKMMTKGLLAATALVSLPALANAAPVITNVNIAVPATTSGVYINVVTGVVGTTPAGSAGLGYQSLGSRLAVLLFGDDRRHRRETAAPVADLAAGAVIGAGSTFATSPARPPAFTTGGDHVFGFKFLNETTGITNYGYARITTTAGANGRPATITQLVYDNTGAALTVARRHRRGSRAGDLGDDAHGLRRGRLRACVVARTSRRGSASPDPVRDEQCGAVGRKAGSPVAFGPS